MTFKENVDLYIFFLYIRNPVITFYYRNRDKKVITEFVLRKAVENTLSFLVVGGAGTKMWSKKRVNEPE